jgi:hypothetical protein
VFDQVFEPKPRLDDDALDSKPCWGGYQLRFKLIGRDKHQSLRGRTEKLRFNATVTGSAQGRTFAVDFSKHEFVEGKASREFDDYKIYVYTPEMIVVEKLRAICQQLPGYSHKGRRSARARDFYDIYCVVTALGVDLASAENLNLARHIFAIKEVPFSFLARIQDQREFHRPDWPSVIESTSKQHLHEFDFYFDFVVKQVERLHALWMK